MKIIFVDTNVLIDFLADRKPFSISATGLFNYAVLNKIKVYISAISYNNIYYILHKQSFPSNQIILLLNQLSELTEIVDVTGPIIHKALKSDFKDFEDAIQYNCALTIDNVQIIVTRNIKDFRNSIIPIMTTEEAVGFVRSSI